MYIEFSKRMIQLFMNFLFQDKTIIISVLILKLHEDFCILKNLIYP